MKLSSNRAQTLSVHPRLRAEAGANIVTGGRLHIFFWPLHLGLMASSLCNLIRV